MAAQVRKAELVIGVVASRSHGVVTRAELLAAGLTRHQIERCLRTGTLLAVHRGIYRVGHRAPNVLASYLAAVRAGGERALLADGAAGHVFGLLKGRPPPPAIVAPGERRIPGVLVRRERGLSPADGTTFRAIPITTVPRTLVDLASILDFGDLARACHEAGIRHGTKPRHVEPVLARRPNSPGASGLRRVLRGDAHVSLSHLESGFLRLLRAEGLPLPKTNRPAGGRRVDCRWPDRALTVELDGYRFHNSRHAWEQDRRREREAYARGDAFRRYTYGDVLADPRVMTAELRGLL